MGLEVATYPADLVTTNPPSSDLETQGANHLQLIKSVIQNCWGTAVRRYVGLPTMVSLSTSQGLSKTVHGNATILVNTSGGAVTLTLPSTLTLSDAGWECSFVKTTTDVNPILLVPPTGTIQSGEYSGLASTRRCIPGRRTRCFWTGTAFIIERVETRPIGTIFDLMFGSLPVGYEWANGQTLSSAANYPEYFAINGNSGLTPDMRGRASFGLDNPGGTGNTGRITVAGGNFDGTIVLSGGGAQNHTLVVGECPTGLITYAFNDPGHAHVERGNGLAGGGQQSLVAQLNGTISNDINCENTATASTGITSSITDHGGNGFHSILPPAGILGKILVVE